MYRNERTRNIILIVLAVCLIGITVAYATLSQNLIISGVANVDKTSWNIHFTNVLTPKVEGQATGGKAVLSSGSTILTISEGTLSTPGDKITYTFDVINEGDLPAEVETTLTQMESCKAENGSDVSIFCNKIGLDLVYADTKEKFKKLKQNKELFVPQIFEPDYYSKKNIDDYKDGFDRELEFAIELLKEEKLQKGVKK